MAVVALLVAAGAGYAGLQRLSERQQRQSFQPATSPPPDATTAPPLTPAEPPRARSFPLWRYPAALGSPSADKPQSKVWRAGGSWWAVMVSSRAKVPTIHELRSNHTWRDTGTVVDRRADSTADVLSGGNALYVVSRTLTGDIRYGRFRFVAAKRSYVPVQGFPVVVATGGAESASLARDSTGTVWATWTQGARVWFAHSDGKDDRDWDRALLPVPDNTVGADDVSAIVAFGGRVGLAWSDQQSAAFRFAVHADGTPVARWTVETPLAGAGLVDDHISLKAVPGDGRVFAAIKTSEDLVGGDEDAPEVFVLRRDPDGTWEKTVAATLGDKPTRPQLLLDRASERVYLFEGGPTLGGTIYYKSSAFDRLDFPSGRGVPFITPPDGAVLNDVSTTKGATTPDHGAVAIAVDTKGHRYFHGELPLSAKDTLAPLSEPQIDSVLAASGQITTTWPLATDDRGVVAYDVYMNKVVVETVEVTAQNKATRLWRYTTPAMAPGTYQFAVEARDAAGNVSTRRTAREVVVR